MHSSLSSLSHKTYHHIPYTEGITSPAIWEALLPFIPTMTKLVKESIELADSYTHYYPDEPDRVPRLDWVFLRKYSPDSDRNSLLVHVDSNMHTLNVALNDDYAGGGLLYVLVQSSQSGGEGLTLYTAWRCGTWGSSCCVVDVCATIFGTIVPTSV